MVFTSQTHLLCLYLMYYSANMFRLDTAISPERIDYAQTLESGFTFIQNSVNINPIAMNVVSI